MTYQLKVLVYLAALVVVVSGAILGSWLYLEIEHMKEQKQLEASILKCQP
ncbi:hypothetical protein [Mycolicibacterium iranicum]|nr:hypothetical protein [Mycolicibacterium iranicum]